MRQTLIKLLPHHRGVTAIEYAFIAGLVAITIVTAVANLGANVARWFTLVSIGL